MSPVAAFVSFRLGGTDGVSVEARKWAWALGELGFETRRVAGELGGPSEPADRVVPGLRVTAPAEVRADPAEVREAIAGADLVVVENICSLPIDVEASRAVARALYGFPGRVVLRHHDLAWQRRHLSAFESEFPPRLAGALHTTVNLRSRRELEARGYRGVVAIQNHFDLEARPADRSAARAELGFEEDDLVVFLPGRAIERKNVPGGVLYAARLQQLFPDRRIVFWLAGPAEDGYGPTLERVLARSPVPVRLGRAAEIARGYAASDVVVFPSTWEGFGNPTVESIVARRPAAVGHYPVVGELLACGLRFFGLYDPEAMADFLRSPAETQQRYHEANLRRAAVSFALRDLPGVIEQAFHEHGWLTW